MERAGRAAACSANDRRNMWVKRTPSEIQEVKRKQQQVRRRGALIVGLFAFVLLIFLFTGGEAAIKGKHIVPSHQLIHRLPEAFLGGLLSGVTAYMVQKKRRTMVCPKCESTKYEDANIQCPCGGRYELMEEMKWQ